MASWVERHSEFINFILIATNAQAALLLENVTFNQTNAISEVVLNLLRNTQLPEQMKASLRKHVSFLRQLGDRSAGVRSRAEIIKKHSTLVVKILRTAEPILP